MAYRRWNANFDTPTGLIHRGQPRRLSVLGWLYKGQPADTAPPGTEAGAPHGSALRHFREPVPVPGQAARRTASISRVTSILSPTITPPVSIGAEKLTPKSRRLMVVVAVNPARVPP